MKEWAWLYPAANDVPTQIYRVMGTGQFISEHPDVTTFEVTKSGLLTDVTNGSQQFALLVRFESEAE